MGNLTPHELYELTQVRSFKPPATVIGARRNQHGPTERHGRRSIKEATHVREHANQRTKGGVREGFGKFRPADRLLE